MRLSILLFCCLSVFGEDKKPTPLTPAERETVLRAVAQFHQAMVQKLEAEGRMREAAKVLESFKRPGHKLSDSLEWEPENKPEAKGK